MTIRFVLHRPRNAQNIGSAARALANTGAGPLVVVEGEQYDRAQAARLAAGADATLDAMQIVRSLDEALAPCIDLVFTSGRVVEGIPSITPREAARRLLESSSRGEVALVFGDEVRGLTNEQLRRANAIATIPTVEKASLNLAQSVLIFAYEIMLARGNGRAGQELQRGPDGQLVQQEGRRIDERSIEIESRSTAPGAVERDPTHKPEGEQAEERLLNLLRENARTLLLDAGFLNKQRPDAILDELNRMIRRARPTKREIELMLGAIAQVGRNSNSTKP